MKHRKAGGYCCWCKRGPLESAMSRGKLAFTRDHINPRARGGGRTVPCCAQCNNLKGDLHPEEWFWFIEAHPSYWKTFSSHQQITATVIGERRRRRIAGEPHLTNELMGHAMAEMPRV